MHAPGVVTDQRFHSIRHPFQKKITRSLPSSQFLGRRPATVTSRHPRHSSHVPGREKSGVRQEELRWRRWVGGVTGAAADNGDCGVRGRSGEGGVPGREKSDV